MAEPLRMGVVGLGPRGFWLSHAAATGDETRLVAMADLRPDMQELARDKYPGVRIHASSSELAQDPDVDAVLIATADRFHAQNAHEALAAGKHVLIEKPMAQSQADLATIVQLGRQSQRTVGVFLEMRYSALYRRAAAIIASGELGRVLAGSVEDHVGRDKAQFFARTKTRTKAMMVSLVLQKGVHSLDTLNWFMGASPRRVAAFGGLLHFGGDAPNDKRCRTCDEQATCPHASPASWSLADRDLTIDHASDYCVWAQECDAEDVSFVNLEYTTGAVASYREIHFAPDYRLHYTIYGDRAELDIEANHYTGESWLEVRERHTDTVRREQPTDDSGHSNSDRELLADFARAAQAGTSPLQGVRSGYESAVIALGVRESLDRGTVVDLPLFDEL